MMNYPLSLSECLIMLKRGDISAVELTQHVLHSAEARDTELGVFVSRFPEQALEAAKEVDEHRRYGPDRALSGIPIGVKDMIATADGPTTGQSLVHDPNWFSGDAEVVARLRAAGAIIVGKTTTMEFAIGAPDPTKPFPSPRNPWDPRRWAGGSSSGSASGVVTGMFLGSLGTDTGGSGRTPGALCGITALKPTFGRVPKSGVIPLGYSLDHVTNAAATARDCAVLLSVMAGRCDADPYTVNVPVPDYVAQLDRDITGVRIGVDLLARFSETTRDPALDRLLDEAVRVLEKAGARIVPVALPYYREVTAASVVSVLGEAFAYHAPNLRVRWSDYFAGSRLGFALAAFTNGGDYVQAQRVRRVGRRAVQALFADVDVIITPTVARAAPALEAAGEWASTLFAACEYAYHTAYWNALGNPALSMPIGLNDEGIPLGAQLIGRPFDEGTILKVADAFQAVTDFHLKRPSVSEQLPPLIVPPPPESPEMTDADLALTRGILKLHGLTLPEDDLYLVAESVELVRRNVDLLDNVPDARDADPAIDISEHLGEISGSEDLD